MISQCEAVVMLFGLVELPYIRKHYTQISIIFTYFIYFDITRGKTERIIFIYFNKTRKKYLDAVKYKKKRVDAGKKK